MNVSDIFKDAFKFPASDWKRFLILGIIILVSNLFSWFNSYFGVSPYTFLMILPVYFLTFLYRGYILRVIKVSINGDNELPAFNEIIKIFIDGLKVFLVNILYFIIPVIVLIVGFVLTFDLLTGEFYFYPLGITFLSIGALLYLLFMFFYEIGLANMAYQGKLEAALSLSEIREIIRKIGCKKYLMIFVILFLITVVSYIILLLINVVSSYIIIGYFSGSISLIGVIIVGILVSPYLELIAARAIGLIYREAL